MAKRVMTLGGSAMKNPDVFNHCHSEIMAFGARHPNSLYLVTIRQMDQDEDSCEIEIEYDEEWHHELHGAVVKASFIALGHPFLTVPKDFLVQCLTAELHGYILDESSGDNRPSPSDTLRRPDSRVSDGRRRVT